MPRAARRPRLASRSGHNWRFVRNTQAAPNRITPMVRQPFQARLDYTKAAAKTKENQRLLNEVGGRARVWARPATRRAQALFPVRKPSAPGFCHILARNPPRFGHFAVKYGRRRWRAVRLFLCDHQRPAPSWRRFSRCSAFPGSTFFAASRRFVDGPETMVIRVPQTARGPHRTRFMGRWTTAPT